LEKHQNQGDLANLSKHFSLCFKNRFNYSNEKFPYSKAEHIPGQKERKMLMITLTGLEM